MGTVYRKTATKPLPAGAKIIVRKGQRLAARVIAVRGLILQTFQDSLMMLLGAVWPRAPEPSPAIFAMRRDSR